MYMSACLHVYMYGYGEIIVKDYVSYGSLGCKQIHGNREQNCGLLRAGVLWGRGSYS